MSKLIYPGELTCLKCQSPVLLINKLIVLGKTEYSFTDFKHLDETPLKQEDICRCDKCGEFSTLNNLLENNCVSIDDFTSLGGDSFGTPAGMRANPAMRRLLGCSLGVLAVAACFGIMAILFL